VISIIGILAGMVVVPLLPAKNKQGILPENRIYHNIEPYWNHLPIKTTAFTHFTPLPRQPQAIPAPQ